VVQPKILDSLRRRLSNIFGTTGSCSARRELVMRGSSNLTDFRYSSSSSLSFIRSRTTSSQNWWCTQDFIFGV